MSETMASAGSTTIAFDQCGAGSPVILVHSAMTGKTHPTLRAVATAMSARFTVINYIDREMPRTGARKSIPPFRVRGGGLMPAATIDADAPIATLINHFTVDPARQSELVGLLERATEQVMRQRPGFISASIHASADGRHVVNYAQWESAEAFQAMMADPACQQHMAAASKAGTPDPALYTVESVHSS